MMFPDDDPGPGVWDGATFDVEPREYDAAAIEAALLRGDPDVTEDDWLQAAVEERERREATAGLSGPVAHSAQVRADGMCRGWGGGDWFADYTAAVTCPHCKRAQR